MKPHQERSRVCIASFTVIVILFISRFGLPADQVEMQNGDHYVGKVTSMTTNSVVLQSEVLGAVTLPRSKIALLTLGSIASTNTPALPKPQALAAKPTSAAIPAPAAKPVTDKLLIQKVESQ